MWSRSSSPHCFFRVVVPYIHPFPHGSCRLGGTKRFATSTTKPDIASMKIVEMREELESYGISTKSFLEKQEIIEALEEARRKERRPLDSYLDQQKKLKKTFTREEEIQRQIRRIRSKSLRSLKSELKKQGISTAPLNVLTFQEQLSLEYITTYATAIVDGKYTKHKLPRNQHGLVLDPIYDQLFVRLWKERMYFVPVILRDANQWVQHHPDATRIEFFRYMEAKYGETQALRTLRAQLQNEKNQTDKNIHVIANHIYRHPDLLHRPIRIKTNIKFLPTL